MTSYRQNCIISAEYTNRPSKQGITRYGSEKDPYIRHHVIKWRHNVKIFTDLESTHQGLSYEVLLDMVPKISKFDLGVKNCRPRR